MPDPTIRPATSDDVEGIVRVAERAWRAAYGDFLDESTIDAAMAEWYDARTVRSFVTDPEVTYFVAEADAPGDAESQDGEEGEHDGDDANVIGYVGGGPADDDPDVADLGAIYVDPDRWGAGIGTALLERFESACLEQGCRRLRIYVLAGNEVGQSFYRRSGYTVAEERDDVLFGQSVAECVYTGPIE